MVTIQELDNLWSGTNIDKTSIKYLCRKYGPTVLMEWIHKGLTLTKTEELKTWHQTKLSELGVVVVQKPPEVTDGQFFTETTGDYFAD